MKNGRVAGPLFRAHAQELLLLLQKCDDLAGLRVAQRPLPGGIVTTAVDGLKAVEGILATRS